MLLVILPGQLLLALGERQWGLGVLAGVTAGLAVVSFLDDLRPLSPWLRLGFQALTASLVLVANSFPELRVHLGPALEGVLPNGLLWFFMLLWLIGYTNAFNFMDGINGLAAGQAVLSATAMGVLAGMASGEWSDSRILVCFLVAGAAAGFLPHNFPAARMFMGDVGSASLGFVLAALALLLSARYGWWLLPALVLVHANFILDTAITLVRRMMLGQKWYLPHREHFYQRLVRAGKSHSLATGVEMILQLVVAALMLGYIVLPSMGRWIVTVMALLIWLGFFAWCEILFRRAQLASPAPASSLRVASHPG
jgi:UDP-N-acetylmuramyl pentapeptide phosphotransferase/UDP-N-acetylglucosamine-1-phosphate transferase